MNRILDTLVYIEKNRQQQTTLPTEPTNTDNYLSYRSSRQEHLKDSFSYLQADL